MVLCCCEDLVFAVVGDAADLLFLVFDDALGAHGELLYDSHRPNPIQHLFALSFPIHHNKRPTNAINIDPIDPFNSTPIIIFLSLSASAGALVILLSGLPIAFDVLHFYYFFY